MYSQIKHNPFENQDDPLERQITRLVESIKADRGEVIIDLAKNQYQKPYTVRDLQLTPEDLPWTIKPGYDKLIQSQKTAVTEEYILDQLSICQSYICQSVEYNTVDIHGRSMTEFNDLEPELKLGFKNLYRELDSEMFEWGYTSQSHLYSQFWCHYSISKTDYPLPCDPGQLTEAMENLAIRDKERFLAGIQATNNQKNSTIEGILERLGVQRSDFEEIITEVNQKNKFYEVLRKLKTQAENSLSQPLIQKHYGIFFTIIEMLISNLQATRRDSSAAEMTHRALEGGDKINIRHIYFLVHFYDLENNCFKKVDYLDNSIFRDYFSGLNTFEKQFNKLQMSQFQEVMAFLSKYKTTFDGIQNFVRAKSKPSN